MASDTEQDAIALLKAAHRKVTMLSEQIEHHVEEEEIRMDGMFSQTRHASFDMGPLGRQLRARKGELVMDYKANGLPKPATTSFSQFRV